MRLYDVRKKIEQKECRRTNLNSVPQGHYRLQNLPHNIKRPSHSPPFYGSISPKIVRDLLAKPNIHRLLGKSLIMVWGQNIQPVLLRN